MGLWDKLKSRLGGEDEQRRRFLTDVQRIAEHIPQVRRVEPDPDDFSIRLHLDDTDNAHTVYLGNVWQEMRTATPQQRTARMERFLLDLFATDATDEPATWASVRERLVPVLRAPSSFFMGTERLPVLSRPFLPFLVEAVVVDSDESMAYVRDTDAQTWSVEPAEIFSEARRNLASCEDAIERVPDTPLVLWRVGTGDAYEASRLLLPGWLAGFRSRVSGDPVAIVPERSVIIVGGRDDVPALQRMLAMAEEIASSTPRYLSTAMYTVDGADKVVPLELPTDHPAYPALRRGRNLLAGTEYKAQKEHLDAVHERDGIDIFVASYGGMTRDGLDQSWSSWAEGVDTLLPPTDLVAMGGGQGTDWTALVPWEGLQELAGHCLKPDPACDPVRYRTLKWPAPSVVAELRRRYGLKG